MKQTVQHSMVHGPSIFAGSFRSDDGGQHWTPIPGFSRSEATCYLRSGEWLYALTDSNFRSHGSDVLFSSHDGGDSWRVVTQPVEDTHTEKIAIVGNRMFAATFGRGVMRATMAPYDRVLLPPAATKVRQNYPNPFNRETWIPFTLREAASVRIVVHDATGAVVRTLRLGHREAGYYASPENAAYWDGRNDDGEQIASGTYFYTLFAGEESYTGRTVIRR